jgi:hypothetical protein
MTVHCVSAEELGDVLDLPANDARRAHVRECPRCRSLAAAYLDFVSAAEPLPAGARPKDARKRLEADLRSAIHGRPAGARATDAAPVGPAGTGAARRRATWWGGLAPRPAWALVALLLLVGAGAVWMLLPREGVAPLVLRNEPPRSRSDDGFVLSPPQIEATGRWRLSWSPVEGADSYQVRFFSSDLDDLAQIQPVTVLSISVTRDQLGADHAGGNVVLWRVVALRGGDAIATSPVGTIALPAASAQP